MTVVAFTARARVRGEAAGVFTVLTDWPRQTAWVPFTVVDHRGGPVGAVGERFAGLTVLGPLRLDDTMTVVGRRPPADGRPGTVDVVKTGPLLGGDVRIEVRDTGDGHVDVEWGERIVVRPRVLAALAALAGPLPGLAGRLAFEAVLRRARPELQAGPGRRRG